MRRERFDQINIVPFVDIVLVLLVIVLATATFIRQTPVAIDLPEHNSTSSASDTKATTISIDANGSYYINNQAVIWDRLASTIDTYDANTIPLNLQIDKKTPFANFSRLMFLLKDKGFKKISVATKK